MRGCRTDLCISLAGVALLLVVALAWASDPNLAVLSPLLCIAIPLIVVPWLEYFELPASPAKIAGAIDVAASVLSLGFAIVASVGVVFQDAAAGWSAGYFCPTAWPVDPFHLVALSCVAALATRRRADHAWYETLSLAMGVATTAVMLLAIKSFTDEWYTGSDWIERVYTGTTEPFPNVTRIAHAGPSDRAFYTGRFACAIACASLEFIAAFARAVRFALSRCGSRHDRSKAFELSKPTHACSALAAQQLALALVLVFLTANAALVVSPCPRWVVHDSRHVALIAGVAYASVRTLERTHGARAENTVMLLVLALGVVVSTVSTIRTMGLVARALANTQDLVDAADPDAEKLTEPWSAAAYAREFGRGADSFMHVYQYADYGPDASTCFATTSALAHALDLALCVVGSAALAFSARAWQEDGSPTDTQKESQIADGGDSSKA